MEQLNCIFCLHVTLQSYVSEIFYHYFVCSGCLQTAEKLLALLSTKYLKFFERNIKRVVTVAMT